MADKVIWIDPDGAEYHMSEEHWQIDGMSGRFMPSITFVEDDVPFQPGKRLRHVKVDARDVDLPIYIDGDNEMELKNKIRYLMKIMNPLKGDGKFKVISPDGSQREIVCRYSGGLDLSERKNNKIGNLQMAILIFRAFDPYWYDTNTKVHTFTLGDSAGWFPFFPLRLSSSTVFADITIENTGDVETWPEWIITGPGDSIVLRNLSTSEVLELNVDLGLGESITIDTRPFHKTILRNNGVNDYASSSEDSSLWALQEGTNSIRIEMANSTEDSSIQLSYKNRYWGA